MNLHAKHAALLVGKTSHFFCTLEQNIPYQCLILILWHRRRRHRAGARAQQNLWGTCKKIKKINEQAKYSTNEVFSVSSLGNGHTATHQELCRSHCILCRRRQQSDTASVLRHPVSQSSKRNPESTPSHTRTVVRECCKGDDATQRENGKFDPLPRPNPLTDRHKKLHT